MTGTIFHVAFVVPQQIVGHCCDAHLSRRLRITNALCARGNGLYRENKASGHTA